MDETISLRTFGHKSSLFFDRRLSLGSIKWVFSAFGIATVCAVVMLAAYAIHSLQPVDDLFARLEFVNAAVQTINQAQRQVENFLATGDDYAAAEQAALDIRMAVDRLILLTDASSTLTRLEEAGEANLNLLRSYHSVAAAAGTGSVLTIVRDNLDTAADTINQEANAVRTESIRAARDQSDLLPRQIVLLAFVLLIVCAVVFVVSLVLIESVARHSTRILRDIREVAWQITEGRFDARVNLTDEVDPNIIQLGLTFNRMADNLKLAQQSELAANEQNRLQLLKLARQERTTAILEERQRIARELHDSVKQQLFSITLSAGAVLNLLVDAAPLVKTHLQHIKQAGHSAQSEMTSLLQELVSMPLQDRRLEDALLDYLNPLCETHELKLVWRTDGTNTLTIAQEHALFRSVQEAVSNVVRHSGATVLRVSLYFGLLTQIVVEDNGKGFSPEKIAPTSNGLAMMRTRLKRVGGRCEVETAPGSGTRLTIQLDLHRR